METGEESELASKYVRHLDIYAYSFMLFRFRWVSATQPASYFASSDDLF